MKSAVAALVSLSALALLVSIDGQAQGRAGDPRVGLKGGLLDAAHAIRHLELIASLPKPEGFFDPAAPAGNPTPPEREATSAATPQATAEVPDPNTPGPDTAAAADNDRAGRPAVFDPKVANRLSFSNSDLAFAGDHLFVGNYHGFNVYDIEERSRPQLLASVVCPGGQGDVSVHGKLLFLSVEQVRGRLDCGTQGVQTAVSSERFRGVRIFDITDVKNPRQVAAVQTCRGSHTHTLVIDPDDPLNVYVYGSGTSTVRSAEELAGCSGLKPDQDPETSLFSIDVIQVPLAAPEQSRIVSRPRIFADTATGRLSGLWQGGNHGPGTQTSRETSQCHDITVFPELQLAAGACQGNGILLDISDPVKPVRLDQVVDKNFAYWHSATFNNDGTKVIFTDEWGGGTRPRCRATDQPTWGADAIFDIVDRKLRFGGYYKLPAPQTEQENCVAHNGSIIPVPGRDIMVQAWYQGGISVFDFTDSANPVEIAFFDRGPVDPVRLITAGYWSAYWYNGNIYASEIARGMDVFRLKPSEHLSQNEIAAAVLVDSAAFNAQHQVRVSWPATSLLGRAYLDQLTRARAIPTGRANAVRDALGRLERLESGRERNAADAIERLRPVSAELKAEAAALTGRTADRMRAIAAILDQRISSER